MLARFAQTLPILDDADQAMHKLSLFQTLSFARCIRYAPRAVRADWTLIQPGLRRQTRPSTSRFQSRPPLIPCPNAPGTPEKSLNTRKQRNQLSILSVFSYLNSFSAESLPGPRLFQTSASPSPPLSLSPSLLLSFSPSLLLSFSPSLRPPVQSFSSCPAPIAAHSPRAPPPPGPCPPVHFRTEKRSLGPALHPAEHRN